MRMQFGAAKIAPASVTTATRLRQRRPVERRRHPPRIARVARRHRGKPAAAHRRRMRASGPLHRHQLRREATRSAACVGLYAGTRPNEGRIAARPQAIRRKAHRAGDVVAVSERRDAGRDRRRDAPPDEPPGVCVLRPRAVCAPAQVVDRIETEAERRRVGAADDDRTRRASSWRPPDCRLDAMTSPGSRRRRWPSRSLPDRRSP